ncbi:hypothetical protein C7B62_21055 [Pleurocapsa sp. CCALA 161]|uniref:hypothetical protein n=1 Tax=Pleurocapsa sp. CCALA 161 TaxID=2107688 RepID=UPI000D0493B1|nr:hypothetical protein [Pleurocapsa sp. CCALA 161]PSB07060.1 hypothetical protein C7B62_21055 [Pleurocapsa sp. CCALA 161]
MHQNLLKNITTVEISTVIVDEIVDEIFIPWEVYQAIYILSRSYLEQSAINLSLWNRYLQLRRQLELAYCLLLIDASSAQYNRLLVEEIKRDLPILSQQNVDWEKIPTRLPEPIPHSRNSMSQVNQLLKERQFIDVLQQLNKRKIALDRRDRILRSSSHQHNITDTTYAQTSLQLNGKIVNRYDQAILGRSDRNLLLQLHEQSTATGEQQWRGLVKFILSLVARQ